MTTNILRKDIILQHTTFENIFLKFLNLAEFPRENISSPFSEDKNASFKLYKNGTFKCNSSGKQGDAFQFVADLKELDCKTQFNEVLKIVAMEMNLSLQHLGNGIATDIAGYKKDVSTSKTNTLGDSSQALEEPLQHSRNDIATKVAIKVAAEKTSSKLSVEIREFTELDLAYWKNLGVEKTVLDKYKVKSISSYNWPDKKPIYTKNETVAFAYELQGIYKVYIPEQTVLGIKKNVIPHIPDSVFGLEQLGTEKKVSIIICEGEKDVLVAASRGFDAVTFGACNIRPKKENIKSLQSKCNQLFICYDADDPGINGMNDIVKNYSEITPIYLPKSEKIKGYDITDYFQEHTAQKFQKIIDLAVKNKAELQPKSESIKPVDTQVPTIIHITENYLSENYQIQHNIIANEIEVTKINENDWQPCNENSLWIEMQKKNIKVPASTLDKILKSDFVTKFNPLIHYFENLPEWDKKTDYIKQYSEYITLASDENKEQFEYHFKKWCVRSVKCATDDNYFNKNAFVLSDDGKGQNIGKTTWIRNLCPDILSNYIVDNLPKDEKDAKIVLTQNFIINLDELASLTKQEVNTLKSLFSADKIKVRFPYDKKDTVVRRVANFIGSTNMSNFLHDETGSVRWICFVADKIDFSYKENFDINNLWSQAFALSNDKNYEEKITPADVILNEIRNERFQVQTSEKDLINKYLEIPKNGDKYEWLSSTEIQNYLAGFATSIRLTSTNIGKGLKSMGFTNNRNNKGSSWAVIKKDLSYKDETANELDFLQ